ncbi:hypothetical protein OG233_09465 [Streptomyces sp. NBC_01218]|uniref:hypothetical protein n=1 Tax=Streptomyces sp. NBC_01218 TaxID=2903780 RepID=UPI002E0D4C5F|nr:hypothetical protein OG233_09465 [Streptomyces sp. NBC_01218]
MPRISGVLIAGESGMPSALSRGVPGAVPTYFVVLPAVGFGEVPARRFGGREAWWTPVVPATGLAPLGALAALTGVAAPRTASATRCASVVLLGVPALFARITRPASSPASPCGAPCCG